MRDQKFLSELCTIFYEITTCPIYLYNRQEQILSVPEDPFSFVTYHQKDLWERQEVCYVISETGLFFARIPVEKTDFSLVMGPFLMNYISDEFVRGVMSEYGIVSFHPEVVTDFLRSVPSGVFSRAVTLVRAICFAITNTLPGSDDLFKSIPQDLKSGLSQRCVKALVQEEAVYHTYDFEKIVFSRLQQGDVDFFRGSEKTSWYKTGNMAGSSLRRVKNMFIVSVALAARAAVAGGLDGKTAGQLSDEYAQTVERMVNLDSVEYLSRSMLIDFAERVRKAALPLHDIPEDISRSIRYIRLHTNSNLSVQEVADAVNLSRSHLSRKFKEIMGFEISTFMMRCKLEEAKSLLMYSDQSIAEISNYLCFSSQSYFTSLFRNKYGSTPKEYRLQHKRSYVSP